MVILFRLTRRREESESNFAKEGELKTCKEAVNMGLRDILIIRTIKWYR